MANRKQIIRGIDSLVKDSRTTEDSWTIGITYGPEERKTELHNPPQWNCWRANSLDEAKAAVDFFAMKEGMRRDPGGVQKMTGTAYVYIF